MGGWHWNDYLGLIAMCAGCWGMGYATGGKSQRDLDAHREWDEDIQFRDWKRARAKPAPQEKEE